MAAGPLSTPQEVHEGSGLNSEILEVGIWAQGKLKPTISLVHLRPLLSRGLFGLGEPTLLSYHLAPASALSAIGFKAAIKAPWLVTSRMGSGQKAGLWVAGFSVGSTQSRRR